LRDNHRDSLKRQKSGKSGQAASTENTWKYARIMEFLIPYMKNRDRSTNLTSLQSNLDISTPLATQDSSNEQSSQQPTQLPCTDEEEQSNTSVPLENAVQGLESTQRTQTTRKRKGDGDILDVIREIESNHSRRQEERENRRREKKHPIEIFFESMAQTTKNMPTYLQNRIKKKVLELVCDAEEELESYSTASNYVYSASSTSASPATYEQLL